MLFLVPLAPRVLRVNKGYKEGPESRAKKVLLVAKVKGVIRERKDNWDPWDYLGALGHQVKREK